MQQLLHEQVSASVRERIRSGQYPPRSRLPSEAELIAEFGVARGTVRRALNTLEAEGSIAARRGAGRVVLEPSRSQRFEHLLSFTEWARSAGEEPGGRVIELSRCRCSIEEARGLSLEPADHVYRLVRVRLLSGVPTMVERTSFIESVGVLLGSIKLTSEGIFEQLGKRGISFAHAQHTIDAIAADPYDASLLEVPQGTPLLRQRRRTTAPDGSPLELTDDRYLGHAVAIAIDNSAAIPGFGRIRPKQAARGRRSRAPRSKEAT